VPAAAAVDVSVDVGGGVVGVGGGVVGAVGGGVVGVGGGVVGDFVRGGDFVGVGL
jgi:hypothetical protein